MLIVTKTDLKRVEPILKGHISLLENKVKILFLTGYSALRNNTLDASTQDSLSDEIGALRRQLSQAYWFYGVYFNQGNSPRSLLYYLMALHADFDMEIQPEFLLFAEAAKLGSGGSPNMFRYVRCPEIAEQEKKALDEQKRSFGFYTLADITRLETMASIWNSPYVRDEVRGGKDWGIRNIKIVLERWEQRGPPIKIFGS